MPSLTYGPESINNVAQTLLAAHPDAAVFTFTGPLGAGKTTLIQAMLRMLGVTEPITSPTFAYVNLYEAANNITIYHFDCYRLPTTQSFVSAGFDEYLYAPQSIAFIEWPEVVQPLLTHKVCNITLEYEGTEQRTLTYTWKG